MEQIFSSPDSQGKRRGDEEEGEERWTDKYP